MRVSFWPTCTLVDPVSVGTCIHCGSRVIFLVGGRLMSKLVEPKTAI